MEIEIASYTVGTNRMKNQPNYHRRWINLVPKSPTPQVQYIVIYFLVGESIVNDLDIGYVTPDSTHYVVGYAPISDFEDMYYILQCERPVIFDWQTDPATNSISWFQLYTGVEPIGEGPKDDTRSIVPPITHL